METAKLSSRGQIVIPKGVRESAQLSEGTLFSVSYVEGQIRLTPIPLVEPSTFKTVAGCLYRPGREAMSEADQKAAIGLMLKSRDDETKP